MAKRESKMSCMQKSFYNISFEQRNNQIWKGGTAVHISIQAILFFFLATFTSYHGVPSGAVGRRVLLYGLGRKRTVQKNDGGWFVASKKVQELFYLN